MKLRGFEIISAYKDSEVRVPKRSTKHSAGYDFEACEDVLIPSIHVHGYVTPVLVKTGIKAYMQEDEYLQLANRSSNPIKRGLVMSNSIGVVDQDYYNNPDNEGHIMFQFMNFGESDLIIRKGEKIGQGIFLKYYRTDEDEVSTEVRSGGFGSTGI